MRIWLVIIVLALSFGLAGCNGSDDQSSPPTTSGWSISECADARELLEDLREGCRYFREGSCENLAELQVAINDNCSTSPSLPGDWYHPSP